MAGQCPNHQLGISLRHWSSLFVALVLWRLSSWVRSEGLDSSAQYATVAGVESQGTIERVHVLSHALHQMRINESGSPEGSACVRIRRTESGVASLLYLWPCHLWRSEDSGGVQSTVLGVGGAPSAFFNCEVWSGSDENGFGGWNEYQRSGEHFFIRYWVRRGLDSSTIAESLADFPFKPGDVDPVTGLTFVFPSEPPPLDPRGRPLKPCVWPPCDKYARPRSKYCSRNCSNKNARARYSKRTT